MQCVTPMFFKYHLGDKKHGKIVPREEILYDLQCNPNSIRQAVYNEFNKRPGNPERLILVPCQKCWACRLNYSAEWAQRMELEAKSSEHNYFLTLTYDEDHVPQAASSGSMTLDPEDTTKFIKSLREYFRTEKKYKGIKYFYCGEYGEETKRPHYHFILMHCPLDIEQFFDTHIDENWHEHWKSKEIAKFWDKGLHDISPMSWNTAAYVARYCIKKIFDDEEQYENAGITKEFVRMSNGIGKDYYEKNKEKIYETDQIVTKTINGNTGTYKPPRYFDKKFKEEVGEIKWQKIKAKRQIAAERSEEAKRTKSDYTDKELLLMETNKVLTKAKLLPRMIE